MNTKIWTFLMPPKAQFLILRFIRNWVVQQSTPFNIFWSPSQIFFILAAMMDAK